MQQKRPSYKHWLLNIKTIKRLFICMKLCIVCDFFFPFGGELFCSDTIYARMYPNCRISVGGRLLRKCSIKVVCVINFQFPCFLPVSKDEKFSTLWAAQLVPQKCFIDHFQEWFSRRVMGGRYNGRQVEFRRYRNMVVWQNISWLQRGTAPRRQWWLPQQENVLPPIFVCCLR